MSDGSEIKERQRAMWTAGNFGAVAERIAQPSLDLLDEIGIEVGTRLLDVACGTGNAAVPAAQRGAGVTGLDLTPKLLEHARNRAAKAGVEIELIGGDAEELPFEDDTYDRVISVFGAMFAPDHRRAAGELLRVCRPGGAAGVCAWTPQGLNGRLFEVLADHLPPPPEGLLPPVLWGEENHVRELLGGSGGKVSTERRSVTFEDESAERWLAFGERNLGPIVMAKAALEPQGRWEEARGDLVSLYEGFNENRDGSMRVQAEYLMTTVTLPA